ncbi:MAG TPA: hypothetical protein VGD11_10875 [Mycobacteriales bacterium]|jgi:hypothetical protein
MPLDPFADRARRAWLPCPRCDHGRDCADCRAGRTCGHHWQYLLGSAATVLHLQCPSCHHLWDHDTRPGAARDGRAA